MAANGPFLRATFIGGAVAGLPAMSGLPIAVSRVVRRASDHSGSTLIEALVAIAILTTAIVSFAGLASVAVRTIALTGERTAAAILAAQKLEELSAAPEPLSPSSPDAVSHDTAGFVEYLDASGAIVGSGDAARSARYVRRWAVSPLQTDPSLHLIHVAVSPCRRVEVSDGECGDARGTVRLATVRSGEAW